MQSMERKSSTAHRPCGHEYVAGPGSRPRRELARAGPSDHGRDERSGRPRLRVAADQVDPEPGGFPFRAARYLAGPALRRAGRKDHREEHSRRPRAFRGDIGEADSRCRAAHPLGPGAREEVGALDQRVRGDDSDRAPRRAEGRRVISQLEEPRVARGKVLCQPAVERPFPDRPIAGRAGGTPHLYARNSLPRSSRPRMIRMMFNPPSAPTR